MRISDTPNRQGQAYSSSINTPTFNTYDHMAIDTALSTLSPMGDVFALLEAKNNP